MFNNVKHIVNEAEKNGYLSEEEAEEYIEKIDDMRDAFFRETGQEDKIVERKPRQTAVQEDVEESAMPETQYAPSNKETKKRARQITKELEEVAKPYFDVGRTDITGGARTKQMYEDAIKVSPAMKKLIKKYFGMNVDYSQISKEEAECFDRMNAIIEKIKEIKKHYDNLKKGKSTPLFSATTPATTKQTTTKTNKSTKTTTPTTGSTTMSDEVYENMKKEIFDNLTGKTETLKKLTTEQLIKKIESASGQKLTPRQIKNLGNRLKAEQSRPPRKTKENKTNKSNTRKRSQETDTTIPETAVEENRDVYSITFTKDALAESKVKRDLASKYEKDDKYWKTERNADGSITFTR